MQHYIYTTLWWSVWVEVEILKSLEYLFNFDKRC